MQSKRKAQENQLYLSTAVPIVFHYTGCFKRFQDRKTTNKNKEPTKQTNNQTNNHEDEQGYVRNVETTSRQNRLFSEPSLSQRELFKTRKFTFICGLFLNKQITKLVFEAWDVK